MNTRTNKAVKGIVTSLMQLGVLIILQILLAPVILKIAGQEVLGAYVIVMQIIGYGLILDFGLSVALSRFLSQSFSDIDKDLKFIKIFNLGRYFILATNLLISIFILILALNLNYLITSSHSVLDDARTSLYFLSVWTFIRTPLILYGYGLQASQNMAITNIISLISSVIRLILSLFMVFMEFGLLGLVGANIAAEFIGLLLQKIYFNKLYPKLFLHWHRPDMPMLRELFAFGLTYWGVNIAIVLSVGSDSIIVGHLYGTAAASIFYTSKIPSFLVIQAIYKISDNAGPAINELFAQGNIEAVKSAYLRILRYSLLLTIPLAIGIIGFNKGIITAWVGVSQYAGSLMSLGLASFALTQVINHINAMITLAVGNMRSWMAISVATGLMTIMLGYVLGKFLGMQWVMLAIALMDIPALVFLIRRAFNGLNLSYARAWREAIMPVVLASLPLLGWVGFVLATDQASDLVGLIACISIFAILWLLGLYTLGISQCERISIKNKLSFIVFSR
jgi:O-antigen/teichoic acid export membrane protein